MTSSAEPLNVGDAYQLPYTLTALDPTFTNWAGVTVTTTVTRPDGTADAPTVTPGTPSGPTRTYTAVGSCSQAGMWTYRFAATGALTEATDGQFEVRGAAAADVYCTAGEVRGHLGDTAGNLDATLLDRAVRVSSRAIDDYCAGGVPGSRRFWADPAPVARTYRPDDPGFCWLDDIATLTGLVVKTDQDGDGTYETTWTYGTDFELEPRNAALTGQPGAYWMLVTTGIRTLPIGPGYPGYSAYRAGLQVTARGGWLQFPWQVNEAAILKSAKLFKRRESPDGFATGMASFGPVRISRYEDPDVLMLLDPFVKRRSRTLNYTPQRYSLFHGSR